VVRERAGVRTVSWGRHGGYVEHPYPGGWRGHEYRVRTYWVGGRSYVVSYRAYYWGGRPYYWYVPRFYYHPAYYGWAYNPWAAPVVYRWGWFGAPWYGFYGSYFTPYPAYLGANLWLTDYILAENLRLAYEAQAAPPPAYVVEGEAPRTLSPEAKQLIAEEVRRQLAAEQQAAALQSSGAAVAAAQSANQPPPALDPAQRIFIVDSNLDIQTANGGCGLTAGDILLRTGDNLVDGTKVAVSVQSSKQGDCAPGASGSVEVADLQEMHNHFREQLDAGMQQLADNSGQNGLPHAPDTSTIPSNDVPPAAPDGDAQSQVQGLQGEADRAEKDVTAAGSGQGGAY